ncbi:MAG: 30S ribosomal protein S20 [Chloroflexota bacterium]|nr:30S ribosomal protein S20 [Chloroflexota bacterium]MDE2696383.1 30S ribosomal protein S20 [Chloroflexota bacterium]MXW23403.1 30S ribosomal protein S20 [Chloroflexota bacterium]MXZ47460.1 30S ribosomal protein S20 [Chloroflexota bacterium]MXZ63665.1 30S ribosomal protein S20 [Chloroflexota bacterium]
MALSRQAKKRARQNVVRAARNRPFRTRASRRLRDARWAVEDGEGDAAEQVRLAQSALDQAARRGIIHRNTAARKKSRLAAQLKALQTEA